MLVIKLILTSMTIGISTTSGLVLLLNNNKINKLYKDHIKRVSHVIHIPSE